MRLKDFDAFVENYCGQCHSRNYCSSGFDCDTINAMDLEPDIDAVPVVRCKDCKYAIDYYGDGETYCRKPNCPMMWIEKGGNWFCADGKRKEEKQ